MARDLAGLRAEAENIAKEGPIVESKSAASVMPATAVGSANGRSTNESSKPFKGNS